MDLKDNEKRDLINLIENNQPLPEKYRFKLFKKKDEIELLWNGKSYDTTNVSLPFQIIESSHLEPVGIHSFTSVGLSSVRLCATGRPAFLLSIFRISSNLTVPGFNLVILLT